MGLVNTVVPLDRLEEETVAWCREMLALSPFALRLLKASFNAAEDGLAGMQQLAHDANLLFYASRGGAGGPRGLQGQARARTSRSSRGGRSENACGGSVRIWLMAARPRTLPAAVAPVLVGTALAAADDDFHPLTFVATLIGAIFIQVGHEPVERLLRRAARRRHRGPARAGPRHRGRAGAAAPGAAWPPTCPSAWPCSGGCYLVAVAGPGLLLVGAASILAGVLYTGGPRPYGYEGLGEVFVFLFFGIVAVDRLLLRADRAPDWEAFVLAVPVGLLAAAILLVNNMRDVDTDRRAGKRTLAVRLGRERARALYTACVWWRSRWRRCRGSRARSGRGCCCRWRRCRSPFPVMRLVRTRTDGPSLNQALANTGLLQLTFCVLLAGGPAALAGRVNVSVAERRFAFRAPLRTAYGELRERAVLRAAGRGGRGRRRRRGRAAGALRRRLARRRPGGAGATAGRCSRTPRRRRPRGAGRRVLAEADCRRRWRRSTSRCGTSRAPRRAGRSRGCSRAIGRAGAGQRGDRRRGPGGRRGRGAAAAVADGFTMLKVKVGVGDDAGRLAAVRRRSAPRSRCAPTPTARGRSTRRSRRCARWSASGSSWSRSRCTASRRCGRCGSGWTCRWRWTRRRPSRAR